MEKVVCNFLLSLILSEIGKFWSQSNVGFSLVYALGWLAGVFSEGC